MPDTLADAAAGANWQRGFPLPLLRRAAACFAEFDGDLCLGAFTRVKETQIAEWLDRGRLVGDLDAGLAAASWREPGVRLIKDFSGAERLRMPPGTLRIARCAFRGSAAAAGRALLPAYGPILLEGFIESEATQQLAWEGGLELAGTKIRASSELVGLWQRGGRILRHADEEAELVALARLSLEVDPGPLLEQISGLNLGWIDHYSSYNERRSWSALALRSFGGDPEFIEKPAEMSRKWKDEHPDALAWPPIDSRLREMLPAAEPILAALPGEKERIRLMRLSAGGALSRHADITDRASGVADGKIMRIHVPLRSDPACRFRSWRLDGAIEEAHMAPSEAWFLDTRKPHAASNESANDRIHLVVDCIASPALRELLPA